jgi:mannan endo-1,6-alpha-mannosidase
VGLISAPAAAIKASAKTITGGLLQLYPNDYSRPATGVFRGNNSWWEAGAAFESLIDYWALTGDSQYNSLIQNVIATEAGQEGFRPTSQPATSGGRADQAIWALTALSATEQNFPSGNVNLLDAAKSVFDQLVAVWDNSTCGGGFGPTWDSPLMNVAFKDTFSLGTFFQLAARLAIHTRNGTYTLWADKAYEWATTTGIVNVNPRGHIVYEGTDTSTNCSSVRNVQWSANSAAFLYGSALMYNVVSMNHEHMPLFSCSRPSRQTYKPGSPEHNPSLALQTRHFFRMESSMSLPAIPNVLPHSERTKLSLCDGWLVHPCWLHSLPLQSNRSLP